MDLCFWGTNSVSANIRRVWEMFLFLRAKIPNFISSKACTMHAARGRNGRADNVERGRSRRVSEAAKRAGGRAGGQVGVWADRRAGYVVRRRSGWIVGRGWPGGSRRPGKAARDTFKNNFFLGGGGKTTRTYCHDIECYIFLLTILFIKHISISYSTFSHLVLDSATLCYKSLF